MYESGALDLHNLFGAVGLNYDAVTANKKDEQKDIDAGLYAPPLTFAQMAVNAQGQASTTSQIKPPGSPTKLGELSNRMNRSSKAKLEQPEVQTKPPAKTKVAANDDGSPAE
jgi:hypothetical protein